MELKLYIILLLYFSVGAVIISVINRKKTVVGRKQNWLKYFTYLFIINLLFASIYFDKIFFHYISIVIIAFGFFEIIRNTFKTGKVKTGIITLSIFSFLVYAFFSFSLLSRQYILYTFFIGKYRNAFKSIDSVKRKTGGSYLLPVSICILFYFSNTQSNTLIFVLPLLILGISDPLAGTFGMMYRVFILLDSISVNG